MEANDRKRPREEKEDKPTPSYGSQAYWEARYQNLVDSSKKKKKEAQDGGGEEPDPFHAWYFSYEELAPILLPLILGEQYNHEEQDAETKEDADDLQENEEQGNDGDVEEQAPADTDDGTKQVAGEQQKDDSDEDDDNDEVEIEESDEEEDEEPERVGLAKNGPISIMEVGCGDVPLGRDLARGVQELESQVDGMKAANILKKIVCLDYSKTVIDAMKKKELQRKERDDAKSNSSSVSLIYEVADARKLSYPNESFDLVLEKGTLDAMLSDTKVGDQNCRSIISECARVLVIGGCMVIVSHLNAHVDSGLEWLNDIVVPGLRAGGGQCEWNVEVHGNAAVISTTDNSTDESNTPASPGPAVYIIHKGARRTDKTSMQQRLKGDPKTIPLRFFSY